MGIARPRTLAGQLTQWRADRQTMTRFLRDELVEGIDYYQLEIRGQKTRPTLSKAGSEKVLGFLQIRATFTVDTATWDMLGKPAGVLCYRCTLTARSGEFVGEGRGLRDVKKDGGDLNKAVKMVQKSSQIDAILRTGALSEVFTQDLDEEVSAPEPAPAKAPTSQDLRRRIWAIVQEQAPDVRSREDVEAWITRQTGMALHPDNYSRILERLL